MTRYADTFKRVTSLVLAFLFAMSSPISVAVAYAQTDVSSAAATEGQAGTATEQQPAPAPKTLLPGEAMLQAAIQLANSQAVPTTKQNGTDQASQNQQPSANTKKAPPPTGGDGPIPSSLTSGSDTAAHPERDNAVDRLKPDETGSLNFEVPITVPPGRNKVTTPGLALEYTSKPSSDVSPFGYGWSINIPYIERLNKNGTDQLYNRYDFTSSLDGELYGATTTYSQPAPSTQNYAARFDNGDFRSYTYASSTSSAKWTVNDKFGDTYIFGSSTTSKLVDPNNSSHIYRWMLEKVTDSNGNYISYSYATDSAQVYPSQITYSNWGTTTGIFQVNFIKTSRTDTASSSVTGFDVGDKYLITEINTKVNGTLVHKYALAYGTGDSRIRSLLNSVTESGQQEDGSASLALPAMTFGYTASTSGWTLASTLPWQQAEAFVDTSGYDQGTRLLDINGDGCPDFTRSEYISSLTLVQVVHAGLCTGWETGANNNPANTPDYILSKVGGFLTDNGVRFSNLTGNGQVDEMTCVSGGTCTSYIHAIPENEFVVHGSWQSASSTWQSPASFVDTSGTDLGTRIVDLNHDGRADIIQCQSGGTCAAWTNNGSGFTSNAGFTPPSAVVSSGTQTGCFFADITGDGMAEEICAKQGSAITVYRNTGTGFVQDPSLTFATSTVDLSGNSLGVMIMDVNHDGFSDVVKSYANNGAATSTATYINQNGGKTWKLDTGWNSPLIFVQGTTDQGVRSDDVDANGGPDLIQEVSVSDGPTESNVYLNKTGYTDLLSTVTFPHGGQEKVGYTSTNGTGLPFPFNLVASTTLSDGEGNTIEKNYTYADGSYYYGGVFDQRIAGFNTITEHDLSDTSTTEFSIKTFYHQGNTTDSVNGEYQDDVSKIGKPYHIEVYSGNLGTLQKSSVNEWDYASLTNSRKFVKLATSTTLEFDSTGAHNDTASTFTYDNTNGNLTGRVFWGSVTSAAGTGIYTDLGTDESSTTISYAASSTGALSGLPMRETTVDHASTTIKDTKHYYDGLTLGSVNAGNETKTELWKTGTSFASTTKTYNSYGLVATSTDGDGNATTYTYDSTNLQPATTTNALSQATGFVYDLSSGKVKQAYDANSRLSQNLLDSLDRISTSTMPDPVSGSSITKTTYTYTDNSSPPWSVKATNYLTAATSSDTYTYFDGLDRKIQDRVEADGNNTFAVSDYVYNAQGLQQKVSLPYYASSTANSSATSTTALYTTSTYDALQRPVTIANAVGTTTNAYGNWTLTVTDPLSHKKIYSKDAYSNLTNVGEYTSTSSATTTYAWDLSGNLTKITDAKGNIRNFIYDGLSRRTAAGDLHDPADTTYGTTTYAYDDAGNATSTVDAKNQRVNHTYDALNRPLTEDYTGQAGTEITYTYDTCPDGKGRLCSWVSAGAASTVQFAPTGQTKKETRSIGGTDYVASYVYDRQGNTASSTYPDNSVVQYIYNDAGQLNKVQRKEAADAGYSDVISQTSYSPLGQVSYRLWANGASTTNTYDANQLYRLVHKVTSGVATSSAATLSGFGNPMALMAGGPGGGEGINGDASLAPESAVSSPDAAVTNDQTTTLPDGSIALVAPKEISGDRTPTSKTFFSGWRADGTPTYTTRIYTEPIHYQDANGALQDIDTTLTPTAGGWTTSKAPYQAQLTNSFGDNFLTFTNGTQQISFSPIKSIQAITPLVPSTPSQDASSTLSIDTAAVTVPADTALSTGTEQSQDATTTGALSVVASSTPAEPIATTSPVLAPEAPATTTIETASSSPEVVSAATSTPVIDVSASISPAVSGVIGVEDTNSGLTQNKAVTYPDALGTGIDLNVLTDTDKVVKNVIVHSLASLGDLTGKSYYELSFKLTSNHPLAITIAGQTLAVGQPIVSSSTVALTDTTTRATSYIWAPIAVDSSSAASGMHAQNIDIRYELQSDGSLLLTKLVPIAWLKQASYPVKADVTLALYAGSGDGEIFNQGCSTWAACHDAGSATAQNGAATDAVRADKADGAGTLYNDSRMYMPVDTSSIPDDAAISNASLQLYGETPIYNASALDIYIVQGTPVSTSTLVNSDFPKVGSVAWSSAVPGSSLATGSYNTFSLNTRALGAINLTGWTNYALLEKNDFDNVAPTETSNVAFVYDLQEQTGTSEDPYLSVTYSTSNYRHVDRHGPDPGHQLHV